MSWRTTAVVGLNTAAGEKRPPARPTMAPATVNGSAGDWHDAVPSLDGSPMTGYLLWDCLLARTRSVLRRRLFDV